MALLTFSLYRKLYWSTQHKLIRSTLSGENVEALFTIPSHCRVAYLHLALNATLYWVQLCWPGSGFATASVHSLDHITWQETVIVASDDETTYTAVALYEDTVYMSGINSVYSAPAAAGGNTTELYYNSHYVRFFGITVVHPDLQPHPIISSPPTQQSPSPTTDTRDTQISVSSSFSPCSPKNFQLNVQWTQLLLTFLQLYIQTYV